MGLIVVSGEPGSRADEVAQLTRAALAGRGFEVEAVTRSRLRQFLDDEFAGLPIPPAAWADLATSIFARLATEHHLLTSIPGCEFLFDGFPGVLKVQVQSPDSRRVGALMLEHRLERPAAKDLLKQLDQETRANRKARFNRATTPASLFDLTCNAGLLSTDQIAALVADAALAKALPASGLLTFPAEQQIQFEARLRLSRHGIAPPSSVKIRKPLLANRSEEIFANLLDFYRIPWEYEPRSFPIAWNQQNQPIEHFTPDFYLPEFDLFIELTTMKQSLVTKKNRKVKLLRQIYPHINIQVFYQRDFQNLIFKHGLIEKPVEA